MPKKYPDVPTVVPSTPPRRDMEQTLDLMLECLQRMDRRDRFRTISSTIHTVLSLIPLLIVLGSFWYVYQYGEVLLKRIAQAAAEQAANYSSGSLDDLMKQFDKYLPEGVQVR